MNYNKILDYVKIYNKQGLYDIYTKIIYDFKDYEKITKNKMMGAICKEYSNYENIISICTIRELKYLKLILSGASQETLLDKKYNWEVKNLSSKLLIINNFDRNISIPLEFEDYIKEALKKVDWKLAKNYDALNEFMIGYCKTVGLIDIDVLCSLASQITGLDKNLIYDFTCLNKLFNYYLFTYFEDDKHGQRKMAIYNDYYDLMDAINEERMKQGISGSINVDFEYYKTIFYHDYDINNKKIKKLIGMFKNDYLFRLLFENEIKKCALLNCDRTAIKEVIGRHLGYKEKELKKLFDIIDNAMDEMPSAVLNGMSPNQANENKLRELENEGMKEVNYVKQKNACLSKKDTKLFYKIYFALLEFTNDKFHIKPNLKIYNKLNLNPNDLFNIINKFWEKKDALIFEFCLANPYNFNKEELDIVKGFKNGIRDLFIIVKFYEEYTGVINKDKAYMIKGINDNLDNILNYKELPKVVYTTILPFKGVLIYDGIFSEYGIDIDSSFEKIIVNNFDNTIKYYHL